MIEIEYIVKDRHGVERLRTADKVLPSLPDGDLEELTIYLARNVQNVERVLKGKVPEREAAQTPSPVVAKVANVATTKAVGSLIP
ncbi:hypothetical protein [uncultured Thiodictyon sp.]|jgi:dsDNA-binding SOS-regulon protein|uniref:hypothetical protein n=1 Tax=uncultured Thiodictyon sp. TaxID=1846217 RepID=UPI0025E1A325|nr:hypothetical protein [uncultured Thiodictyon sp.]